MISSRQPVRPLPVILQPLADELLSSWVSRHAAFLGVSTARLLRHYQIEVTAVRDLDLNPSRRDAVVLASVLRCSPHLVCNMMQSRGGPVRSGLLAIRRPPQFCRACAHRHAASPFTRGARLRSWMEGWRITCPICGAALDDFRLYTRLFRADRSDALLVRIEGSARDGERIMDRASKRQGGGFAYIALMRGLLCPQAVTTRLRPSAATAPRLLDIVVPGSEDFFRSLAPEIWPCSSRILPLSVRVPVLAGVAVVFSRPGYWVERLLGAVAPHQAGLLQHVATLAGSQPHKPTAYSHVLRQ